MYQPTEAGRIDLDIATLHRLETADYLFLARREMCRLSTMSAAYEPGNPANLDWLAYQGETSLPVIALYLHVEKVIEGRPWGGVILLDYQTAAKDIRIFSALPESQRRRHIQLLCRRYTRTGLCSMLEAVQYLKTGR